MCLCVCGCVNIYNNYLGSPLNSIKTAKSLTNVSMVLEGVELALSNTSI